VKKQHALIIMALALVLAIPAAADGPWQLQIHQGGKVHTFDVSTIDSMTFVEADLTVPTLVSVPAGQFQMGDGVAYCGIDQHLVILTNDFLLGQTEVTNQEYLEGLNYALEQGLITIDDGVVRDAMGPGTEILIDLDDVDCEIGLVDGVFLLRDAGYGLNPDFPVIEIRWFGAACFCDWLNHQAGLPLAYTHDGDWPCNGGFPYDAVGYRLPTDAEWEYAAQFDGEAIYPWGDDTPDCDLANFAPDEVPCTGWGVAVGSYPAAPAALGLLDMAGNAFEWCNDWFQCELGWAQATDPPGPATGSRRVLHSGGWVCLSENLRNSSRSAFAPSGSSNHAGFRLARTAP